MIGDLGLGIGMGDLELEIGDWELRLGLRMGIVIKDRGWGLKFGIRDWTTEYWGFGTWEGIGHWDWGLGIGIQD